MNTSNEAGGFYDDIVLPNTSSVSAGTPSGTISSEGSDGAGKNLPPYYKLAYIMRIS
jgi:hypothetical protein